MVVGGSMLIKGLLRSLIAFTALSTVSAASFASGAGGSVKVYRITVIAGRIYVYATGIQNPDNCATANYFVVSQDDPGRSEMMSILLTAKSTDRHINMWFEGCTHAPWHASAPIVSALTLE